MATMNAKSGDSRERALAGQSADSTATAAEIVALARVLSEARRTRNQAAAAAVRPVPAFAARLPYFFGGRQGEEAAAHAYGGPLAAADGSWMDFRGFLRCLWRRRRLVSATVGAITLAAIAIVLLLAPQYKATAKVKVADARSTHMVDRPLEPAVVLTDEESIESEVQVITSPQVAERIIDALGLQTDPEFNPKLRKGLFGADSPLSPDLLRGTSPPAADGSGPEVPSVVEDRAKMVDAFLKKIAVAREGKSRVISVTAKADDAVTSADLANALAETYVAERTEALAADSRRATEWLNHRLAELRGAVESSETAVEEYRQQSGLVEGKDSTIITQQLSELSSQLTMVRAKRVELEAKLKRIEAQGGRSDAWQSVPEVLSHPLIADLRAEEYGITRQLAELEVTYGPNFSRKQKLRAQLARVRADIGTEAQRVVQAMRKQLEAARLEEQTVSASLDALKTEASQLSARQGRLRALQREASANQALLETFLQWLKKTSGIQEFQQPDARVISYAEPPLRASFPQKRLMVGLAFLASLGLAVALALVFEHLDRSFRSADQVEAQTLQRNLAVIPKVTGRLFRRGVPEDYVLHRPRSAFAEGLRTLHANLVLGDDDPPKILLFSSACPREGKTSLALSYARLLAGQGARVTLVDADLHHGRIARRLGIDERPGLADLLAVEASIDDVLERDPEARLAVIPHGGSRRTPQELLLGAQFGKLLQRLAIANDFVIIDSPPVLAVADAPLFARHADKTVYVVHWGATAGEEAITGLRRLQEAGADVAGVVLNAVDMRKYAEYAYGSPGTYRRAMERYYVG